MWLFINTTQHPTIHQIVRQRQQPQPIPTVRTSMVRCTTSGDAVILAVPNKWVATEVG
jgi:hypothetical protein